MNEKGFREWLEQRDVTNPLSVNSIRNRLSRARRVERELRPLGIRDAGLDQAYESDGLEAVLNRLRLGITEAEAGRRPPASLVPSSENPANQMRNLLSAVRNYKQFLDWATGRDRSSGWNQLEEMRQVFLDRAADFIDFEQSDGVYWEQERGYKDEMVRQVAEILRSPATDEQAGAEIYHVLCTGPGAPLLWWTSNQIEKKQPELVPEFRAAIGALARDGRPIIDAIDAGARRLEALRERGAASLSRGEVLGIAITVPGFVRPSESAPFKIRLANKLARQLTGRRIFVAPTFRREEVERYHALLGRIYAAMRDDWGWKPRDLIDVQGFAWAALDPRWAPADEDEEEGSQSVPSVPVAEPASYWFVGAAFGGRDDQLDRFIADGIWEVDTPTARQRDQVLAMRPGDPIAIKSAFVQKLNLPFDNRGLSVSVMRIKARGRIIGNPLDGEQVEVKWEPDFEPRDWYFYTLRETIWNVRPDNEEKRRLIAFAFDDEAQDYDWWCEHPSWLERFGSDDAKSAGGAMSIEEPVQPYSVADIVDEGAFVELGWLEEVLGQLRSKKNLILQGPPGTGKTWLAKRLGYALVGAREPGRVMAIQFQPSLSYEDFVRGYRPDEDGKLKLLDGAFLRINQAALDHPDKDFVLVVEEINRGNPSQVFGDLLTLIEADKRREEEALRLAYPREEAERVFVPPNLHLIGTMNLADRSLALVDLALRRRFAFRTLMPALNDQWRRWCIEDCGFGEEDATLIAGRLRALNEEIASDRSLGEQFQVGHSYVTPSRETPPADARRWFREVVETEIGPLLEEYWFDSPAKARDATATLTEGL